MALRWAGRDVSVDQVTPQVFTPGMKGSFQVDMISAARRNKTMAIPIEGLENLLKEIEAGHPVVVFENLALKWIPQWHYAIVFGYDLDKQTVAMHSGPEANKQWDIRKFERSWKLGDYWALVVLPPGELSVVADELTHSRAAAALEELKLIPEAQKAYASILKKWPESLAANIGAANIAYANAEYGHAVEFLSNATKAHPTSAVAWHNLAFAYQGAKKLKLARDSAKRALTLVDESQKNQFLESLKPILKESL
jgi:tetratricopeptide (TPR) repeat protein